MTEHVHEWKWDIVDNDAWFYCSDKTCKAPMGALEIEARINATERLSAEMATKLATMVKREWEGVYSWSGWQPEHDALKAYASILEGKDENE